MGKDPHAQASKLYLQILDLIEEAGAAYAQTGEDEEDDDEALKMSEEDMIDAVVEEAGERGLEEDVVERLFKAIDALAHKAAER